MSKHKLLAGLVLGGAAYAAYHALDLEQREALKGAARDRYNALKDRAVDYAFYAADAADDFKEALNDRLEAKDDAPAWQAAATADDDPADDIVLSSDEVPDLTPDDAEADSSDDESDENPETDATDSDAE
ncbi:hypothetical protein [Levilactobacillus lindianensis]|uniref:hypothetical protein n=1 Tax=Levilactobacillus lindianensis TaxID=2486018 RepID=UPI000F73ADA1|nr:hypothetical protein [Levilactobacillus lindianensis]